MKNWSLLCTILLMGNSVLAAPDCPKFTKALADKNISSTEIKNEPDTFDPKWYYFDTGSYIIPLPEKPEESKIRKNDPTFLTTRSKKLVIYGGQAASPFEEIELFHDPKVRAYFKKHKIANDYEAAVMMYDPSFATCKNAETPADAEIKAKLAGLKKERAKTQVVDLAVYSAKSEAIALAYPKPNLNRWSLELLIKSGAKGSRIYMMSFQTEELRMQFLTYLPLLKDKKFFSNGKPLTK